MQNVIEERYTDKFFRRYSSRVFFIWLVCTLIFLFTDKIEGSDYIMLSCFFVAFNFIQKAVDSWKADAVIKLLEALRD